jgi:hypothetical protein
VDRYLESQHDNDHSSVFSEISVLLKADLDEAYNAFISRSEDLRKQFREREYELRISTDDLFQQRQRMHIGELHELEKAYAVDVIWEEKRPVKERRELEESAQKSAIVGDYDQSMALMRRGLAIEKAVLRERVARVTASSNRHRQNALERQKCELAVLNDKLCEDLAMLNCDYTELVDHERRKFIVSVKAIQQRAVTQAIAPCSTPEKKFEMARDVNALAIQIVKDLSGISLPWWSPTASPVRDFSGLSPSRGPTRRLGHESPLSLQSARKSRSAERPKY